MDNRGQQDKPDLLCILNLDSRLPPALLNFHYKMNVMKKIQKKTKSQGHNILDGAAKNDMKVLSDMLNTQLKYVLCMYFMTLTN